MLHPVPRAEGEFPGHGGQGQGVRQQEGGVQGLREFQVVHAGVEEEAAGEPQAARTRRALGIGEEQPVLRPGEGHVAEPPLLLQPLRGQHPPGGEAPLAEARQEHGGEFQPLGGVNGHEAHAPHLLLPVQVREQGGQVQVFPQGDLLPGARLVVEDALLQLREVVQPVLGPAEAQVFLVAALRQQAGEEIRQLHALPALPQAFDEAHVIRGPGAVEDGALQPFFQGVVQALPAVDRLLPQKGDALFPHAAPGLVHRAQEAEIVPGEDHAQVAQHVLDLLAVVELHPVVEGVGDLRADEGLLEAAGLVVGPVEDGHAPGIVPCLQPRPELLRHPGGLRLRGFGVVEEGLRTPGAGGEEVLFQPVPVVGDEGVGRRQHRGTAAVVLLQVDGPPLRVDGGEIQDEAHVRPPEGVDGLVRVPHHEEVAVLPGQDLGKGVFVLVDVLVFVHHDVFQPGLPFLPAGLVRPQDVEGEVDEIVEIQAEGLARLVEIAPQDLLPQVPGGGLRPGELSQVRVNEVGHVVVAPLVAGDVVRSVLHRELAAGDPQIREDALQHVLLVQVVQHGEGLRVLHHVAVLPQEGHGEGVEGADVAQVPPRQEGADAPLHLRGGLVGEGDAEDGRGGDAQGLRQVHEAAGEGLRLARAGPGHHAHVALRGGDGLPLGLVQIRQQLVHGLPPLAFFAIVT